jgi:hypothetical protein
VYGYDIWRAVEQGEYERIDAIPAPVTAYHDTTAVGGLQYRYYVKAYDLGGNRSPASNVVQATLDI